MAFLKPSMSLSSSLIVALLSVSTYPLPLFAAPLNSFPPENSTSNSITWSACPSELQFPNSLVCGTLSVPVDWNEPHGEHFDLGIVKLPAMASNSTQRIGNLFINPGGPGGRASETVAGLANGFIPREKFLASFDLIGVDPRGIGLSNQVQCDRSIYAERVSLFPQTGMDLEKLFDKSKRLGESCRNLTGSVFAHLDTISVAKDYEAVRVALDDQPMNYLGLSYGSQLGAQYAALFPDKIRTLSLDGILQHSISSEAANILVEASSYERGVAHFFEWAGNNESSALRGQDVRTIWSSLLANASETPLPAPSCNGTNCRIDVNAEEFLFNAQHFFTFAGKDIGIGNSWEMLASALLNATNGDASAFATSFSDPTDLSFLGVGCLDWTRTATSLSAIRAQQIMALNYAPFTRGASQIWTGLHACLGWPSPVQNPPMELDIKTNATVLLTSSTSDPSTGLPWALGMTKEFKNAVLALREGDGHTSFWLNGQTTELIIDYLITGVAPKPGLVTTS